MEDEIFYVYQMDCQEEGLFSNGVFLLDNEKLLNPCCHEFITSGTLEELNEERDWKQQGRRYIMKVSGKGQNPSMWELSALNGNLELGFQVKGDDLEDSRQKVAIKHMQYLFALHDATDVVSYFLREQDIKKIQAVHEDKTTDQIIQEVVKFIRSFDYQHMPKGLTDAEEMDFVLDNTELFSKEEVKTLLN